MTQVQHISSLDAYEILQKDNNSFLIDVRTIPEWSFVGLPNLNDMDKDVYKISWLIYPTMEVNTEFNNQLNETLPDKENSTLLFLCKSGGRSFEAAKSCLKLGYKNCYNISDGFEGSPNDMGQRGKIDGWKGYNLPWFQI